MATYVLTINTDDLDLGVLNGARILVDRKRTVVSDIFPSSSLYKKQAATNSSGIATVALEPDDGSVYHELKIFDLAGIPVYSTIFSMPPQAIALDLLPIQDIISASAAQAVAAAADAAADAIATAADRVQTGQDVIATNADAVQTAADRVQTGQDVIATAADRAIFEANTYKQPKPDINLNNALLIFCGDSTTEQDQSNGYGMDRITTLYRGTAGRLRQIYGVINFGGSGHKLSGWVNDALGTIPTIPDDGINYGTSQWDYYGHKPTGATSLTTALAWRAANQPNKKAIWTICYGINDCILDATIGNQTQQQITDYLAALLRTAINTILGNVAGQYDYVVLRTPNPMVARPYVSAAGFPSPTQYPSFGTNDAADQALVEKWNQGIRNAYIAVKGEHSRVVFFDTWDRCYGKSDTTVLASLTGYLGDLVHPSVVGYRQRADAFVDVIAPLAAGSIARQQQAEAQATANSSSAWLFYPNYFRDNNQFRRLVRLGTGNIACGSNYIDLPISLADFYNYVGTGKTIYISIGDVAAQSFASYTPAVSGANTRLLGVTPTAAMQSAVGQCEIYESASNAASTDSWIVQQVGTLNPRLAQYCTTVAAGVNYIDIAMKNTLNRVSSKFPRGILKATLYVGGTKQQSLALSTASSATRSGASSNRIVRVLFTTGTDYNTNFGGNSEAVLVWDDAAADPRIHENMLPRSVTIPHTSGGRGFMNINADMFDGGTFTASLTEIIASAITIDIYKIAYTGGRTLLGTCTIPANTGSATMASGNPTTIYSGTVYEFVISSAFSQSTGTVTLTLTPS